MPTVLEGRLRRTAARRGLKGDRADAYVYGTLRKTGWTPSSSKKKFSFGKNKKK